MIGRLNHVAIAVKDIAKAAQKYRESLGAEVSAAVPQPDHGVTTVFITLPKAPHGNWNGFLTNDALREGATIRSTSAEGCSVTNPMPFTPTWQTVIDFLDRYVKR